MYHLVIINDILKYERSLYLFEYQSLECDGIFGDFSSKSICSGKRLQIFQKMWYSNRYNTFIIKYAFHYIVHAHMCDDNIMNWHIKLFVQ